MYSFFKSHVRQAPSSPFLVTNAVRGVNLKLNVSRARARCWREIVRSSVRVRSFVRSFVRSLVLRSWGGGGTEQGGGGVGPLACLT